MYDINVQYLITIFRHNISVNNILQYGITIRYNMMLILLWNCLILSMNCHDIVCEPGPRRVQQPAGGAACCCCACPRIQCLHCSVHCLPSGAGVARLIKSLGLRVCPANRAANQIARACAFIASGAAAHLKSAGPLRPVGQSSAYRLVPSAAAALASALARATPAARPAPLPLQRRPHQVTSFPS